MKLLKLLLIVLGFILFYIAAVLVFDPTANLTGYFTALIK